MARQLTVDELVALNWLDTIAHDYTFTSFVRILETSCEVKKIVVFKEPIHDLTARLRGLLNVLEKLQQQTYEIPNATVAALVAQDMKKLLTDLVVVLHRLRTFLDNFSQEQLLCQFIRIEKLLECLQQAHEGVDDFVYEVRRSHLRDEFIHAAANLGLDIAVLNHTQAYWPDQVTLVSQALQNEIAREIEARDPAINQLFEDSMDPDVSSKARSTLAFETLRNQRRGFHNTVITVVRDEIPAYAADVSVTPWFLPSDSICCDKQIGQGGCGDVWVGKLDMKTQIVIKRLLVKGDESDGARRAAHEREIQVWQQLNHPHILQFYGATAIGADCCIVSELAPYGKLYSYWVKPDASIDPVLKAQVWRLLFQASLGLQHMHERGFVHGDLKCDNIFVGDDMKTKLADFGFSFPNGNPGEVPCTEAPNWLAPECLDREPKRARTAATDVFMFGMCIVEAITGTVPWGAVVKGSVRYQLFNKRALPEVIERLAPAVRDLVKQMCALEPADRISMDAVAQRLNAFDEARDPRHLVVRSLEDFS